MSLFHSNFLKKILYASLILGLAFIVLILSQHPQVSYATKTYIWGARAKVGGASGSGAIDDIPDANITDEDGCILIEHGERRAWVYTFNNDSTASEHWPDIVQPDDAGGNGDWELVDVMVTMNAAADMMTNEEYRGIVIVGRNAGGDVDQGNPVYWDSTDSEWKEADADVSGTWPARGIAVETGSDGNPLTVLVQGIMRHDDWSGGFSAGDTIYLSDDPSDNAGIDDDAPSTSTDCVQVIGWALSDDEVYFNFSGHWLEVE